jgi:hypothetical protein
MIPFHSEQMIMLSGVVLIEEEWAAAECSYLR